MRYFNCLFTLTCTVAFCFNTVCAENWIIADNNGRVLKIDTDSINWHNSSIYYNIKYFEPSVNEEVVATIQTKDDKSGVVQTCKYSDYVNNNKLANYLTNKQASKLKVLNKDSLVYNANLIAKDREAALKAASTPTLRLTPSNPVDFSGYMRKLQKKIKANWNPPKGDTSKRVVLMFTIAKDGSLLDYKITTSSGNEEMDNAAIKALMRTAPFAPLPENYNNPSIDIQFTFDYNVFSGHKKVQ